MGLATESKTVPKISVVCPVFNTPSALLTECARSVLAEPPSDVVELILVDDASTDRRTLETLQSLLFCDPRVKLIQSTQNRGPSASRNQAIAIAAGDWIGFIDSDDLWRTGRSAGLRWVLAHWPEADWIGGNYTSLYADGSAQPAPLISHQLEGERLAENIVRLAGPGLTRKLIANSWLHLGSHLIRRSRLNEVGGFSSELFYHEDGLLFTMLSLHTPLYLVEHVWYTWRRERDSLMANSRRISAEYLKMYDVAACNPRLRPFRREYRWARYNAVKGLALNNLLSGNGLTATAFAIQAWSLDPREIQDFGKFLRLLWPLRIKSREQYDNYSRAERAILKQ